ncbi:MAG: nicotinate (nicotinamide) nucleotide adenylyltransferase [Chromatiales bacterium]|nr:nicotinate (nicotinamide) nucleotide adenylyltransferase [Chromatiales bacterium]
MNNQTGIVAIYGGAFDPIHLGHIKIALQVLAQPEISQLRLLPCYAHPNKSAMHSSATHRYNMLQLIAGDSLIVDRCELERADNCYTADTATYLRKALGNDLPIAMLLGADAYNEINDWYKATELPSLLHLIVVARPGVKLYDSKSAWQRVQTLQEMSHRSAGNILFMSEPFINISSSQIRLMIAQGIQPRYLLPAVVWSYIKKNRLYHYREVS